MPVCYFILDKYTCFLSLNNLTYPEFSHLKTHIRKHKVAKDRIIIYRWNRLSWFIIFEGDFEILVGISLRKLEERKTEERRIREREREHSLYQKRYSRACFPSPFSARARVLSLVSPCRSLASTRLLPLLRISGSLDRKR